MLFFLRRLYRVCFWGRCAWGYPTLAEAWKLERGPVQIAVLLYGASMFYVCCGLEKGRVLDRRFSFYFPVSWSKP